MKHWISLPLGGLVALALWLPLAQAQTASQGPSSDQPTQSPTSSQMVQDQQDIQQDRQALHRGRQTLQQD
ncbi:MAG TPA: hypothetical protein VN648_17645, partial [Candidatus Methylomirabilis sp.]|nr:hypothetical protein [Candidatus Methylomirabilis sp.]